MKSFISRHIGPQEQEVKDMLGVIGLSSLEQLIQNTIPDLIRIKKDLAVGDPCSEEEALALLREKAKLNQVRRSLIGMGYSDTHTPPVILRNIFENPGWYTQYTPYQAEIAQGRLEALLNFQTMIGEMTGLPVSNASLLDEGTACAEAMMMAFAVAGKPAEKSFFVDEDIFPQTLGVIQTRAHAFGIRVDVGSAERVDFEKGYFAILIQNPSSTGEVKDLTGLFSRSKAAGALNLVSVDLLSLALYASPGSMGADIAVGSAQRFGVPVGFGGPHAAFLATKDDLKRLIPGRIVGVSQDAQGKPAIRLALQTREQHIRRDKATSNICTAQVLLAIMASMYAVYHGPKGIFEVAQRVRNFAHRLRQTLLTMGVNGLDVFPGEIFDTVSLSFKNPVDLEKAKAALASGGYNVCESYFGRLQISLDEKTTSDEVLNLETILAKAFGKSTKSAGQAEPIPASLLRRDPFLRHSIFERFHSETEMLRYIHRLQGKDLSLTHSMIALGSCTMKLNATAEMIPVSWPEFGGIHPFAPADQTKGYTSLFADLEKWLGDVTGFDAVSLQPNAGSQGEYAGLLVIKKYHESRGQSGRNVCLIPKSAHGTNPASAALAGMSVVVVECDSKGNVDLEDLKKKANEHAKDLSALMITYPSTHGVFEEQVRAVCEVVHAAGGQVYMDGANMNAQIGFCKPGEFGPDVCHLNLHKTFCIPHGGGGPGMGPIGVKKHLAAFLPNHPVVKGVGGEQSVGPVSAAPWGSASILPISWMYIKMMGSEGLTRATAVAILNANYIAKRLESAYPVLYRGEKGRIAHECIFDLRKLKDVTGIEVEDVAKRLMDYGFHAPTISFPVAGTIMVEPTESESKRELDRFCEAMLSIREEIAEIERGIADRLKNVLKGAPHTAEQVVSSEWDRPYTREKAVFPLKWVKENKFWPSVARINNVLGDRNLVCACPPMEDWA